MAVWAIPLLYARTRLPQVSTCSPTFFRNMAYPVTLERAVGRGGMCGCGGTGQGATTPNSNLFKGEVR